MFLPTLVVRSVTSNVYVSRRRVGGEISQLFHLRSDRSRGGRGGRLIAISFQHLRAARAGKSRLAHTWAINVYPRTIRRVFRITSASGNGVGCAWACKRPATAANVERNSSNGHVYRPGLIRASSFSAFSFDPALFYLSAFVHLKKGKGDCLIICN